MTCYELHDSSFEYSRDTLLAAGERNAMRFADAHARGLLACRKSMHTDIAVHGERGLVVERHRAEGTRVHANAAADALFRNDLYDAKFVIHDRVHRASGFAGRVAALVAVDGEELRRFLNHVDQLWSDF